jgi:hypothetical protein
MRQYLKVGRGDGNKNDSGDKRKNEPDTKKLHVTPPIFT